MTLQIWYWIFMAIWLIFSGYGYFTQGEAAVPRVYWGGGLLFFILFLILGWQVFGSPVH